MGATYKIPWFAAAADGANLELLHFGPASTKAMKVRAVHVEQSSDYGDAQAEGIRLQLLKATGTSAGGTAITPTPDSASYAAMGGQARGGTAGSALSGATPGVVIAEGGWNVQAGWHFTPPQGSEPEIAPGELVMLRMVTDAGDALDVEVLAEVELVG